MYTFFALSIFGKLTKNIQLPCSPKFPDFQAILKQIILFTSSKSGDFSQQTVDNINVDKEISFHSSNTTPIISSYNARNSSSFIASVSVPTFVHRTTLVFLEGK